MGSFPTAVTPSPAGGAPAPSGGSPQGGQSPAIKLAMMGEMIKGLAQQFPQGQQGVQMMLKGLQMVQSSAAASSTPQPPAAPPR